MSTGAADNIPTLTPAQRRERRRAAHRIQWKPSQFVHHPLAWDNSAEIQELKERFPKRFLVWLALVAILNGQTRQGWAAYNTLASQAGCDRRTAMLAVKWLIERGLLLRRYRFTNYGDNAPNYYMLLTPPSLQRGQSAFNAARWSEVELLPVEAEEGEEAPDAPSVVEEAEIPADVQVYPEGQGPADLVLYFHRLVHGEELGALHTPLKKELQHAQSLLVHGWQAAEWSVLMACRALGNWRPDVFGAIMGRAQKALARYQPAVMQVDEAQAEREAFEAYMAQSQREAAEAAQAALAQLPGLVGRVSALQARWLALPPLEAVPTLTRENARHRMFLLGQHGQREALARTLERLEADLQRSDMPPQALSEFEALLVQAEEKLDRMMCVKS